MVVRKVNTFDGESRKVECKAEKAEIDREGSHLNEVRD